MPSPPSPRPAFGRPAAADALAWSVAAVLSGLVTLRILRRDHHHYQIALEGSRDAAFSVAPLVLAIGVARHRPVLAAVATALTGYSLRGTRRPADRGSRSGLGDPALPGCRVVTANLLRGNVCVADLGRQLIDDRADVVVLQELSAAHLADLNGCGLLDSYPHHVLDPTPNYHGSAVLSRWPLSHETVLDVYGYGMATADVSTPGGPLHVVSVHVVNPAHATMITTWRDQLSWLAAYVATRDGPVVLAGDFNATVDHRAMQTLLDAGLTDAYDRAGAGRGFTWPQAHWGTGRGRFVPVMRLDHVLVTADLGVRAARTAASAGSDHRRVIADLSH